jgi:hypothetical protein
MIMAIALVAVVFGWQGGRQLVESSYDDAKVKVSELREQRREQRDADDA